MKTTVKEVNVKFLADTRGYVQGINAADDAVDRLTDDLHRADKAQEDFEDSTKLSKVTVDELGLSVKATGEGAIDAATGMSGLGAAITSIGDSAVKSVTGLSTFTKGLMILGGTAVVGVLLAMVTYWDDITEAIGLATIKIEDYDRRLRRLSEASNLLSREAETSMGLLTAMGLTEEAKTLKKSALESRLENASKSIGLLKKQVFELAGTTGFTVDKLQDMFPDNEELQLKILEYQNMIVTFHELSNAITIMNLATNELSDNPLLAPKRTNPFEYLVVGLEKVGVAVGDLTSNTKDGLIGFEQDISGAFDGIGDRMDKKYKDNLKVIEDGDKKKKEMYAKDAEFQLGLAADVFSGFAEMAEEDAALKGGFMIAEATANAATAVMTAAKTTPPLTPVGTPNPFFVAQVAAIGILLAGQISTIVREMGAASGGSGTSPATPTPSITPQDVESASPTNMGPAYVPVLVTDDFNTVNDRVKVVTSRASLY